MLGKCFLKETDGFVCLFCCRIEMSFRLIEYKKSYVEPIVIYRPLARDDLPYRLFGRGNPFQKIYVGGQGLASELGCGN